MNMNEAIEAAEFESRAFGATLIQKAGVLLHLPQNVMSTAATLFQRFFCRQSFKEHKVTDVAEGALFLACKLEEKPTRIHEILIVFTQLYGIIDGSDPQLDTSSPNYWELRSRVLKYEGLLLKELGFDVFIEHSHKFVLSFLKVLDSTENLAQTAWSVCNDCLKTDVCVRFRSEVIASASIFVASRICGVCLPETPKETNAWWLLFDTTWEEIDQVVSSLAKLYNLNTPRNFDFSKPIPIVTSSQQPDVQIIEQTGIPIQLPTLIKPIEKPTLQPQLDNLIITQTLPNQPANQLQPTIQTKAIEQKQDKQHHHHHHHHHQHSHSHHR